MSTLKESEEHFMSKKLFSKLTYDNYLFDIPRLMDICLLYGSLDNRPLLKKMLENIFSSQPKFFEDLSQAAKTVSQVSIYCFFMFCFRFCRCDIPIAFRPAQTAAH